MKTLRRVLDPRSQYKSSTKKNSLFLLGASRAGFPCRGPVTDTSIMFMTPILPARRLDEQTDREAHAYGVELMAIPVFARAAASSW
jgi:hypothetical protein